MPPGKIASEKPSCSQIMRRQAWRLAALDQIDHQRNRSADRPGDLSELLLRRRRLDEQHVGAGIAVARSAIERGRKPFDGHGIGARNDQRPLGMSRVDRGLDLPDHFGGADDRLVFEVAATLGKALILELDGVAPARSNERTVRCTFSALP